MEDSSLEEDVTGPHRDKYVDSAKESLSELFKANQARAYYMKQLEVLLEKQHFHWVTARAINELIDDGLIRSEQVPLAKGTRVKFVFHKGYRYYRREIKRMIEVIREYARPKIARACGEQADLLFFAAFAGRGFLSHGQDTNEFQGHKWTKTNHNLDFIIEKDGITYGCEVKNTWDYIDRAEMRVKTEMCAELGIRPVFIVRWAPKTYINEVRNAGGFTLLFVYQVYPLGQEDLVERIQEILGLGVDAPASIPSGIIDRFMRWHEAKVAETT